MEIQFQSFINRVFELLNMQKIQVKNENYIKISNTQIYVFDVNNHDFSVSYTFKENEEFKVILLLDDNYVLTTNKPDMIFQFIVNSIYKNHMNNTLNFSNDWCMNFL
jgi:hypothetical protein